jgi:hypothetical protein
MCILFPPEMSFNDLHLMVFFLKGYGMLKAPFSIRSGIPPTWLMGSDKFT